MKYTRENLIGILQEGKAIVLEEYPRYNQRLVVKFRCSCGAETSKKFEMLNVHRLPYCEGCSLKNKEKRKVYQDNYNYDNNKNYINQYLDSFYMNKDK